MNKHDYWKLTNKQSDFKYKHIHELLKQWKIENNISESCVVHHRDDTEECRKYNEEHYELWGFNEDDTFEYGKYVVFMTRAAHNTHHNKGENHPFYGKHLSDEHRAKISHTHKGKKHSDITREKISAAQQEMRAAQQVRFAGIKLLYSTYKNNGGNLQWNDFQKALKSGDITFETQPISVYTDGR